MQLVCCVLVAGQHKVSQWHVVEARCVGSSETVSVIFFLFIHCFFILTFRDVKNRTVEVHLTAISPPLKLYICKDNQIGGHLFIELFWCSIGVLTLLPIYCLFFIELFIFSTIYICT